jgi:hypothetical protein
VIDLLNAFSDRRVALGIVLAGVVFFGALTLRSLIRPDHRSYLPSLLLIDFGIVNSLVRNLFFYDLSAHPATLGGMWRLATGAIVLWGFVRFERTRRRERRAQKG